MNPSILDNLPYPSLSFRLPLFSFLSFSFSRFLARFLRFDRPLTNSQTGGTRLKDRLHKFSAAVNHGTDHLLRGFIPAPLLDLRGHADTGTGWTLEIFFEGACVRKIKGYEDWTAALISRSVRSTLSLDSKLWKASLRFFQSIGIRQMNCSRIEISFYKNILIDISSGIHGYDLTDIFSRKRSRIPGILRDKVKIFRAFFLSEPWHQSDKFQFSRDPKFKCQAVQRLLRFKRNSKGRRRGCRANKNDAPAALFEYYPKAPRMYVT